jgi:hypothetical protein
MLPINATTITKDIHSGTFGLFLATSTEDNIVLSASVSCSQEKDNTLTIGFLSPLVNNNNLVDTEGVNGHIQQFQTTLWKSGTAIYWNKELSSDKCFFQLVYIPTTTTTISTTTTVSTINGFTYGDILSVLFLIMIFTVLFFSALKEWIFGVKTENPMKNKYNKDF